MRKINVPKVKLESYRPFGIIGVRKIGKSTLMRDIILEYCNNDATQGLIISCGKEDGCEHLSNVQVETIREWDKEMGDGEENLPEEYHTQGIIQLVEDLVNNKATNGIKLVCFDTLDELYSMAWEVVKKEHKKLKGQNPKSLNDALGGLNKTIAHIMW